MFEVNSESPKMNKFIVEPPIHANPQSLPHYCAALQNRRLRSRESNLLFNYFKHVSKDEVIQDMFTLFIKWKSGKLSVRFSKLIHFSFSQLVTRQDTKGEYMQD